MLSDTYYLEPPRPRPDKTSRRVHAIGCMPLAYLGVLAAAYGTYGLLIDPTIPPGELLFREPLGMWIASGLCLILAAVGVGAFAVAIADARRRAARDALVTAHPDSRWLADPWWRSATVSNARRVPVGIRLVFSLAIAGCFVSFIVVVGAAGGPFAEPQFRTGFQIGAGCLALVCLGAAALNGFHLVRRVAHPTPIRFEFIAPPFRPGGAVRGRLVFPASVTTTRALPEMRVKLGRFIDQWGFTGSAHGQHHRARIRVMQTLEVCTNVTPDQDGVAPIELGIPPSSTGTDYDGTPTCYWELEVEALEQRWRLAPVLGPMLVPVYDDV